MRAQSKETEGMPRYAHWTSELEGSGEVSKAEERREVERDLSTKSETKRRRRPATKRAAKGTGDGR